MADRVIVAGMRRGRSLVPVSEIKQMVGRAGRKHGGSATVHVVVPPDDEGITESLSEDGAMIVSSALSDEDVLSSTLLPEIVSGLVLTIDDALKWGERSFCANPPIEKALELLREIDAITIINGNIRATDIGVCAARFYYHPADVCAWAENFTTLFENDLQDEDLGAAWAIGNVPCDRLIGDLGDRRDIVYDCKSKLPFGLDIMDGSVINVISWWYLMGGPSVGDLRFSCLDRRKDFGRFLSAIKWLDSKCMGWNEEEFFSDLEKRVRGGIRAELLPLCKIPGISKGKADYLFENGISGISDLSKALDLDIDEDFLEIVKTAVNGGCVADPDLNLDSCWAESG